jgi:hypothetical protein
VGGSEHRSAHQGGRKKMRRRGRSSDEIGSTGAQNTDISEAKKYMWITGSKRNRCCKRIHEKRCRLPGLKRRRGRWRSEEAEEERARESEEETVSVLQDRVVPDITAYHRSPRVRTRAGTFEPLLTDLLVGFFGGFFKLKKPARGGGGRGALPRSPPPPQTLFLPTLLALPGSQG